MEDREVWHLQSMGLQRVGHNLAIEQQQNSWFSSLSSRNLHNNKSSYVSVVSVSVLSDSLLPRGPQFFKKDTIQPCLLNIINEDTTVCFQLQNRFVLVPP